MYTTVLALHSWIRWIALIAAVGTTLAALRGKVAGANSLADRWGMIAMMVLDTQMLLGLLLYFVLSPNTKAIMENFGAAMKDPALRFWAVEHTVTMFAAIAAGARGTRARPEGGVARRQADAAADLLRPLDGVDHPRHAMAGPSWRAPVVQRSMIPRMLSDLFAQWAAEVGSLSWLAVALVAAILEVSLPHFGCVFVSAGAVAAAAAAFFGFGVAAQIGVFVVVMTVSIVALRQNLLSRLGGRGIPSRTEPLVGRHGQVTHDIDPTLGTGRINVGGEDWAARCAEPLPTGTKIRVVAADGIVLEVTRA